MITRAQLVLALLLSSAPLHAQLTMRISAPHTPADASMYVAGDFNQWNPAASGYRLQRTGSHFTITLPDHVRGPIEFKFTLGSWQRVETTADGGDVANRSFTIPDRGIATYEATVDRWRDSSAVKTLKPSATKSVSVMDSVFAMPQLGRTRRVWIYLPPDYASSTKRYPVLYMHDGQNVFDAATSYAGEWGVDETLDSLHARGDRGVIVVAPDHAGDRRMHEYSPWVNARYGGGEGDAYVEFLVKTLKPYIDQKYRTLPDRAHTAVAGSSMGGLISYYAALKHPDVFGMAGVFSPAFWIAPEIVKFTRAAKLAAWPRLYFVSAQNEATTRQQLAVMEPLLQELAGLGYITGEDLVSYVIPDGAHSEWFWRREFPKAYTWLFR